MSSRITQDGGADRQKVYTYNRQTTRQKPIKLAAPKINRNISGGLKAGAKAALGGSTELKGIIDARKISKAVDELTGIQDTRANYYIHNGANRRVVQLRESKSDKLVRQVPTQETLNRLASMRRFVGMIIDFKG